MKPGTPGFVGARLREAREARWLTATSLADLLGVTRSAVSQYENDVQSPRPDVMKRICDCLNLPLHFFLRPLEELPKPISFYRSMSAATKAARIRAERRREWLRDIVLFLTEYVVLPTLKFPMFDLPNDPKLISDHNIESIAAEARKFWKLSNAPISNVVRLLENNGAIVARDYFELKTLDAFSLWDNLDNTPYVILGADKGSACRSRTDIGHEIGHLLLHHNIKSTTLNKKAEFDLIERQAFKFSGAFHLPAEKFSDDFYSVSLDALRALQYKWKVSLGLMIERVRDLELISEEQRQRLWININRRGWRIKEPLDDEIEVERPLLLKKSFDLLVSEGIQNKETILEKLPYSPSDIEALTEFSLSSLGDQEPSLTIKSPLKRSAGVDAIANGKILQFKQLRESDN
jgi:Zn-dependent peptidase ImmA (M78 family)/DNA-binding XRE family transcriptional regulator